MARRSGLNLLIAVLTMALNLSGGPLAAHEGHGAGGVRAEAVVDLEAGQVTLSLDNGGPEAVTLRAVYSEHGVLGGDVPFVIPSGSAVRVFLTLPAGQWPGVFTLVLDFGDDGFGPVLVSYDRPFDTPEDSKGSDP